MKLLSFLVFFSIVFVIYAGINFYIYVRGLHTIPEGFPYLKITYKVLFIFIASSYFISRFLERAWISPVTNAITLTGSVWLAAMVYLLFIILAIDIVRLINYLIPFLPGFLNPSSAKVKVTVMISAIIIVTAVVAAGWHYAHNPVINAKKISISKRNGKGGKLTIALASDLHLGGLAGEKFVNKFVNSINNIKPDIILLAGDIASEDTWPLIKSNSGSGLSKLYAPFGIYAITGNHEYIGGIDLTAKYIEQQGITLLRDTVININDMFYLAGREDRDIIRFTSKKRKSIKELLSKTDKNLPVILMDHQPFQLSEAEYNNVDLQISGHTHDGQLWPFNHITNSIYKVSCGYTNSGKTHYWVSPGYGWWGPPVRTSARPEIGKIEINFY